MAIIIDGYNFLFADRREMSKLPTGELERMRNDFLGRLARLRAIEDATMTVVFDGAGNPGEAFTREFNHHGVKVIFSDRQGNADAEILRILSESNAARDATVVTDDNELRAAAKRLGARPSSTEEYKRHMRQTFQSQRQAHKEPMEKFEGVPANEVEFWMRQFGVDPDEERKDKGRS